MGSSSKRGHKDCERGVYDEVNESLSAFKHYQEVLDEKNGYRDDVIRKSRDITSLSKKIIFEVHRQALNAKKDHEAFQKCSKNLAGVRDLLVDMFKSLIAAKTRRVGGEMDMLYRNQRSFSGGVQEYIEAAAFAAFVANGDCDGPVLSYNDCVSQFEGEPILLDETDYLLGITDITGEIMRLALTSVSNGDRQLIFRLTDTVRRFYMAFLPFHGLGIREFSGKMKTMKTSLMKLEKGCYDIHLQSFEAAKMISARTDRCSLTDVSDRGQDKRQAEDIWS
eukprot:Nk52_evm66s2192 gene=Nk52_evmTU66s2192